MLDFLEKLRRKPVKTRKKIAAAVTAIVAVIIFAFWLGATVWKINHLSAAAAAGTDSISSDISNMIQSAKTNAPAVSF